jgi:hypothetical protein
MGTETRAGSGTQNTQKQLSSEAPRCSVCRQVYTPVCAWNQGRCPHHPSMFDQIMSDPYKTRFYNLFKLFTRKK